MNKTRLIEIKEEHPISFRITDEPILQKNNCKERNNIFDNNLVHIIRNQRNNNNNISKERSSKDRSIAKYRRRNEKINSEENNISVDNESNERIMDKTTNQFYTKRDNKNQKSPSVIVNIGNRINSNKKSESGNINGRYKRIIISNNYNRNNSRKRVEFEEKLYSNYNNNLKKVKVLETEKNITNDSNYTNLNFSYNSPKNRIFFDDLNLLHTFLNVLEHNSYICKYLEKNENEIIIKHLIKKSEQNKQYCLTGLLYYIYKYIWTRRPEKIIQRNELEKKYKSFIDCYIKINCKDENPAFYLYDIGNIELIIAFIFGKINNEISNENMNAKIKKFCSDDNELNKFMNNFFENNKSIISNVFTGFYEENITCMNCKERMMRSNNKYNPIKGFNAFNYINFDLSCNNRLIGGSQILSTNINSNIYDYLNLGFSNSFFCFCNNCNMCTQKYIQKEFLSFPKVLTVILKNNEGNFYINNEINLNKYERVNCNFNYYLIALLCKYNYNNSYITYCFNYKDGNWYYYSKNEKEAHITKSLDINAIPFTLVYQSSKDMNYEYNNIDLDMANNKKGYIFKFQNGHPPVKLFFGMNAIVKEAKRYIKNLFNLKGVKLIINAQIPKDNDKLGEILTDNQIVLVLEC